MKGIDKIVSRLESDAQAEIDALNAETRRQCDEILAGYREKADAAYEQRLREGKAGAAQRAERMASAADLEAKKLLLAFKQEMVGDVFTRAAAKLAKLPKKEYIAFLSAQAVKAAINGQGELVFNKKDAAEVGAEVAKAANAQLGSNGKLTVSKETRNIPGGMIVKNGDIEANCSVDVLVHLRRNDLSSQVAEILFA